MQNGHYINWQHYIHWWRLDITSIDCLIVDITFFDCLMFQKSAMSANQKPRYGPSCQNAELCDAPTPLFITGIWRNLVWWLILMNWTILPTDINDFTVSCFIVIRVTINEVMHSKHIIFKMISDISEYFQHAQSTWVCPLWPSCPWPATSLITVRGWTAASTSPPSEFLSVHSCSWTLVTRGWPWELRRSISQCPCWTMNGVSTAMG